MSHRQRLEDKRGGLGAMFRLFLNCKSSSSQSSTDAIAGLASQSMRGLQCGLDEAYLEGVGFN